MFGIEISHIMYCHSMLGFTEEGQEAYQEPLCFQAGLGQLTESIQHPSKDDHRFYCINFIICICTKAYLLER